MIRALPALLLVAALTTSTAARRDPLAGRVAGEAVNCINLARNASPEVVDERIILYRETERRIWRTGPVGDCPGLQPLGTLIIDLYGPRLCRNDRFRVLAPQQFIPGGYCRFDRFTPYDKPKGRSG